MPKEDEETAAVRSRRGARVTEASIAAGKANLAKGRESRQRKRDEAKDNPRMTAGERWSALLDGTLTVADLDDDEIKAMRVKGKDGVVNKGRKMPSHLAQQFRNEAIKRAVDRFRLAAPEAVKGLLEIANDPDAKPADRIKAYAIILDRSLGRTPQEVRISSESDWDALGRDLAGLGLDRDVVADADGAREHVVGDEASP